MHLWALALTAFVASGVEAIEAITIVFAVAYTHTWRIALLGAAYALVALIAIVGVGGSVLLAVIPIRVIRIAIGAFLVWYGYGWLRKSIMRYAGRLPLRDEAVAYERRVAALREKREDREGLTVAFNGVFLEGLEVAIIVVTVGSASGIALETAGAAAAVAIAIVAAIAVLVRAPFSRVPENAMKFVVGVMLVSFGIFWFGEGAGVRWWHDDLSLLLVAVAMFAIAFAAIAGLRRTVPVAR